MEENSDGTIDIEIDEDTLAKIDQMVIEGRYPNRDAVIEKLLRDYLDEQEKQEGQPD